MIEIFLLEGSRTKHGLWEWGHLAGKSCRASRKVVSRIAMVSVEPVHNHASYITLGRTCPATAVMSHFQQYNHLVKVLKSIIYLVLC